MILSKIQAQSLHTCCQNSITELNKNLSIIFNEIEDGQICDDVRMHYAQSMANLIDVMEKYVYINYPELRPY